MSKADLIFKENCKQILENGFSTENEIVRAKWEDGTPAHTVKTFGVVNRYDLQEEFPMMTLRQTFFKSAIDEICLTQKDKILQAAQMVRDVLAADGLIYVFGCGHSHILSEETFY
ncbi:MAG: SIS domain-containing protein, partial [Anaerotignum sp.]|nr:SIS domain-containing protein [Anaerotignum sp.]